MLRRSAFCQRLRERALDLCDWIDFRPDVNLWPLLIVPVLVLLGGFLNLSGMLLVVAAAAILTGAVALVVCGFAAIWVLANALLDTVLLTVRDFELRRQTHSRTKPATASRALLDR